jgi:hypothetical protein
MPAESVGRGPTGSNGRVPWWDGYHDVLPADVRGPYIQGSITAPVHKPILTYDGFSLPSPRLVLGFANDRPTSAQRLSATADVYRQVAIMAAIARALYRDGVAARYPWAADHNRDRFNAIHLNEAEGRPQPIASASAQCHVG